MKTAILHDEHGQILSVSKVGDLKAAGSKFAKVGLIPGPGQRLIEVEMGDEHDKQPLRELHAAYQVDVATSKLVKKVR
jgi:hypothetical protein